MKRNILTRRRKSKKEKPEETEEPNQLITQLKVQKEEKP